MRTFRPKGYNGPLGRSSSRPLVTETRLEEGPRHDRVHVWNRGGKSGVLVVTKGDGRDLIHRLYGGTEYEEV